jgi:hypothetical protein
VAALRPAEHHRTSAPAVFAAAATEEPIEPGCRIPVVIVIVVTRAG